MLGWVGSGWVVLGCVGLVSKEGGCTWVVVDSSSEESMEVSHPSNDLNCNFENSPRQPQAAGRQQADS